MMVRRPVLRLFSYLAEGVVWYGLGLTSPLSTRADRLYVSEWLSLRVDVAMGLRDLEAHLAEVWSSPLAAEPEDDGSESRGTVS